MEESPKLTKKQLQEQKRILEKEKIQNAERMRTLRKWGIIAGVVLFAAAGFWWLIKESTKPLPGKVIADLGREHVAKEKWEKFTYNSNPPTSGPHDAQWTKAGIYDKPQGDGYLVHSLEHGYVIISYNCANIISSAGWRMKIPQVYAHEGEDEREHHEATESGALSGGKWDSKECKDLKNKLSDIANENRLRKLIVVPRDNVDANIALTAWGRIDKMEKVDKKRIVDFINAFRDHGPEQTME